MQEFFKDLFNYHHHFNQTLSDQLLKDRHRLPQRTLPLFSHLINAHQIWNTRLAGGTEFGVNQVHNPEDFKRLDAENYQRTMQILTAVDPGEIIYYINSTGIPFKNTAREILFHIINHTTHHRGQVISDIRQAGMEPPASDYIFYKRQPQ